MARTALILTVFVASPGDVPGEREAVAEAIVEFNLTWGKRLGVVLELIRWETHAFPGVGEDPQAVINEQVGDDYDVFIGILWQRFGTPTGRAGSGTEEEFQRAYQRHQQNPGSVAIMIYFSTAPFYLKTQPEMKQYAAVLDFKGSLGEKGILYNEYPGPTEFPAVIRMHLARQIQLLMERRNTSPTPTAKTTPENPNVKASMPSETKTTDDDAGLMDLIEDATSDIQRASASLDKITIAQNTLNAELQARSDEIASLTNPGLTPNAQRIKQTINHTANAMTQFVRDLTLETVNFSEAYRNGATNMAKAISLAVDFGEHGREQIESLVGVFEQVRNTISQSLDGIRGMKEAVARAPRATTAFNQARRQVVDALDRFELETNGVISLTEMMARTAKQTLDDWPTDGHSKVAST
jgi:hypothetical protein